ncbi:glycosyltransferase involved in cell wall biosynthesis [Algoriphagus boseongensis]|uniref:Glycosyltransferase involved in cell wall biosynthesis n=1 Tax=Algoriphagus boseongensis TaxID=1442587 RepID=A0A4R6TD32_9BACT|nr:glycosyltransferase family 4 protein [Algoriphagus boseongensis]TDQ19364.1 glycosyltransferase involved in cell wall biosynthesis [Algoriphagus boseongensis]
MKKLAIITTHPIQYNAPWFALLASRREIDLKVFYTWSQSREKVKDKTFGREIQWDIPLLEGYSFEFVENVSKKPGSHNFFGIDNPSLIWRINAFNPDAILVFGWNFKSHLKVLRYFKGKVPVWFRGDSTLLDENPGVKTWLRRQILRWVYQHVEKAFYVGLANKSYFLKHGLLESQLVNAPHAIDIDRFSDNIEKKYEEKAKTWRQELGFSSEDLVILFAGKMETKKQPDFLMEAVIKVNEKQLNPIKLILVGNGPLEAGLKERAKSYNFITFIPFQNQTMMPVVYRLGDVFCLPSKGPGETWGLAVNEAMASGRAVIVSDRVGCAEDLVSKSVGWILPTGELIIWLNLLLKLESKQLREMGNSAMEQIQAWSFERMVKAIESEI